MSGLFSLDGRVALVVGAAEGGLGAYAARALHEAGATVALADLADRAADLATTARACGPPRRRTRSTSPTPPRSPPSSTASSPPTAVSTSSSPAPGAMLRRGIEDTDPAEWQHIIDVNLTGTWLLDRAVLAPMRAHGYGRIINFSTVYAERVGPIPESAYYAAKAGIANVTRAVASEAGRDGVTANCLAPAVFYPTRMTAPLADDPERLEWFTARTMLGRLGDPATDLTGPLLLLASDAGAYLTGQILYVDGGWSAW